MTASPWPIRDAGIRQFWIEHCQRQPRDRRRTLAANWARPAVTNIWVPDGYKDTPADRLAPRQRLRGLAGRRSSAQPLDPRHNLDAVEGKLFGIGSESYVVGSHEFYLGYAAANQTLLCLDAGHFHPTETIADKISSVLLYVPELLLHVSRGVRWDSDHVVTLTDELQAIMQEMVRGDFLGRTHIGLDFFDASINRVAAWAIGTRNALKALQHGPARTHRIPCANWKSDGNFTTRLALLEELKSLPHAAVWDYYCLSQNVPIGMGFMDEITIYEKNVQAKRA